MHAVVTGGGSGIGAATARVLAGAGARVTIMGRDAARLEAAAKEPGVDFEVADVTDREQVATAFGSAAARNGPVGILVNNAGAAEAAPFARMDDDHWDRMIAVNLDGVYNCSRAVIGSMVDAGNGRIVNIASTAARKGYAYVVAYCAAKHGVIGLTRALALECAARGVTVNAVCPGYTDTDLVASAVSNIVAATGRTTEEARAELEQQNPQGRFVQPEEVAETVLWICEQPSINGQSISVDGGEVM